MQDHELVKSVKVFKTTAAYLNLDAKLKRYKDLCREAKYPCVVLVAHDATSSLRIDLSFTPLVIHTDFLEQMQKILPEGARIVKSEDWKKVLRVVGFTHEDAYTWGLRLLTRFEEIMPVRG